MNLVLSFVHPAKAAKELGPFAAIRLDADGVSHDEDDSPVALRREHQWEVEGERYYRLDCATRVAIHFERGRTGKSRRYGPFQRFSAVDGIAYVDDRVFAFVERKAGDWFCYDDGHHWPVMVVADASASRKDDLLKTLAALLPQAPGVFALWQGAELLYVTDAAPAAAA